MGHTNNNAWVEKHDRHDQRSDVSNVRGDMKKNGAGAGNWGTLGDEVLEERKEMAIEPTHSNDKLQVYHRMSFRF
ncbi:hypothetical protein K450DRAFT_234717 [Umbelopsis ramanniana AG]|uniref:Hyaluronan/mRNA-binding protein domain-containing protein n=1 Tax=Umbelopsis ramanniana AG TaxID=1314678 RepID=A0AAD5HGI8_UMBRA|nr:uncharacterized protein K450DRAFT_234717 [Umbelopsis ramanniana AG]KAI8581118.1 hypothetical protein K450DRAFT_234717 [Umbelopsis ramanniana AG]